MPYPHTRFGTWGPLFASCIPSSPLCTVFRKHLGVPLSGVEDWVVLALLVVPWVLVVVFALWLLLVSRRLKQLERELERRMKVWVLK